MRPVDVEAGFIAYLKPLLSVPVSTRVPSTRPPSFLRLYKAGGSRVNLAQESAFVVFEAWGPDDVAAFTLAQQVWSALDAADGEFLAPGVWLAEGSGLSSPVENNDPQSGQSRYQFNATVVVNLEESA